MRPTEICCVQKTSPGLRIISIRSLEEYFKPNRANHGSYHWNWTTTDEVFWRENYEIWMKAVREFAVKGGIVGAGEDAGYIYMLYGFSLIRELELHHEAGFHPIDVIRNATGNNARILGQEKDLGRVRGGYLADLSLWREIRLKNLKYLYPTGVLEMEQDKLVRKGGVAVDDQGWIWFIMRRPCSRRSKTLFHGQKVQ